MADSFENNGMIKSAAEVLWEGWETTFEKQEKQLKAQAELEFKLKKLNLDKLAKIQKQIDAENAKGEEKNLKNIKKLKDKYAKEEAATAKKNLEAAQKSAADNRKKLQREEIASLKEQGKYWEAFGKSIKGGFSEAGKYLKERGIGGVLKDQAEELFKAGANAGKAIYKELVNGVDDAMKLFVGRQSRINARLQGSRGSEVNVFGKINTLLEKNLAASPYVMYEDVLSNIDKLVDAGVAYNLEQRAFLMTISDKIATTFDAANGTLLQIIRIQQEDSTAARLGMQASLTNFLNRNFKDTSYMSMYNQIASTLADSIVQLGTSRGAEYEYTVQKWLGSLASVGVGSSTLTSLASAINALGTGDLGALSGSSMQNLLVMALNRAGGSYGDVLTGGLNASNANQLLQGVLSVWMDIAKSDNQVVRKQMADLFGLSMSDLVAITNLSSKMVSNISSSNLSYSGAIGETNRQLGLVSGRMHISELINNAYKNVLAGVGRNIANSPGMMATWLINDLIKQATGGINIPTIGALGTFLDLNTDLNSLIQLGMVGIGTIGQIGNVLSSISNRGGLNLSAWNASQYNTIGGGAQGVVSGVAFDTSMTTFVGNTSGSDIYSDTLIAAREQARQNEENVIKNEAEQEDQVKKALVDNIQPDIEAVLELLQSIRDGNASFAVRTQPV